MGLERYKKQEPRHVRGSCVLGCGRPQRKKGTDQQGRPIYRALCDQCHRLRHGIDRAGYQQHKGQICEECGFVPVHPCQLDVDHKDGDHGNDNPDNLTTLCANCHRLKTHLSGESYNMHRRQT